MLIEETAINIISDNIIDTRNYFRHLHQKNNNLSVNIPNNNLIAGEQSLILHELTWYLSVLLEDKVDSLLWWYAQKNEYSILSIIAHDYLSIQATSVASEQAFSIVGQTITSQRNRLNSKTARASLCLRSWI